MNDTSCLTSTTHQLSVNPRPRLTWIDFARFLAILFVVETHSGLHFTLGNDAFAGAGCIIFFFLAGFFNRKGDKEHYKRCGALFLSCLFWELIYGVLSHHGQDGDYFSCRAFIFERSAYRGVMWFLEHMLLWMLIAPIFCRFFHRFLRWLVVIALWAAYFYIAFTISPEHAHISLIASSASFFLGCNLQHVRPSDLHQLIFKPYLRIKPIYPMAFFTIMFVGMLVSLLLRCPFIESGKNAALLPILAYLMLGFAYFSEIFIPRVAAYGASFGVANFLIYAGHHNVIYLWTGGWIHTFGHGEAPPIVLTVLLCIAIVLGSRWIVRRLGGRYKLLDIIIIGR